MIFNDYVKTGQFMYMAEANGMDNLVTTREAQIQAIIHDLRECGGRPSNIQIVQACRTHGIYSLSAKEMRRIENALGYW